MIDVVTADDSIQSRNGGEYLPSTTNGPTNQAVASAMHASHVRSSRRRKSRPARVRIHTSPRPTAANVAAALIPPMSSTASADRADGRSTREPGRSGTSGTSIHGVSR